MGRAAGARRDRRGRAGDPSEAPGNLAYDWAFGDEAEVERIFAAAAHATRLELVDNRAMAMPMEERGATADWEDGRLTVAFSGQGVWSLRDELADKLGLPKAAVRVTTPDVGGGFGIKGFNYPEYFAVAFAARELGRPVHWMSSRGEAMLTDNHGRDHVTVAEAAFDAGYRLQALRIRCVSNLGAYNSPFGQHIASELALKVMPGVYDVQKAFFAVKGVFTNTTPVDAYRGAGRPEAIYVIERLMDWSARDLGLDPVELRRRNFIPKGAVPLSQRLGGDLRRRRLRAGARPGADRGRRGRLRGAQGGERARRAGCAGSGSPTTSSRSSATRTRRRRSPSPRTAWSSSASARSRTARGTRRRSRRSSSSGAGCRSRRSASCRGTPTASRKGGGTGGSRSVTMQGNSINHAADVMIDRFRPLAEEELEVGGPDLVFEEGVFRVAGTDRAVDLMRLAGVARRKGRTELLVTTREFVVPGRSYPNGAHFAEVEVDPETGRVEVAKYTVVDDFGYLINPMLAEGQVHGGVVQGIGQAVVERVAYSPEGQLLRARSWTTRCRGRPTCRSWRSTPSWCRRRPMPSA